MTMAESAASTETAPAVSNKITVEDTGPARKRLTITVPAEVVNEKLATSMSALASQTSLPGFRKGRAPRELLQKKFGGDVRKETRNQLVAEAYAAAIEEKALKPVGDPEPAQPLDEIELVEGKPLTVAIDIEVVPEFELPKLEGIEIKKPMLEISDDLVEAEVDRQRANFGASIDTDGGFEKGDRVYGYATATKKGEEEPFFQHDDVLIVHPGDEADGRGQVLGLLIDRLAGMLKGKQVGDTIDIATKGPEQHEREDIRGADITISYQIRRAERIEPAPVQTVVDAYGLGSEDNLRQQIRFALEQRLRQEQAAAMRDQVYDHLADETADFELPEKLSAAQARRMLLQYEIDLLHRGIPREDVDAKLAEARGESEELARRRLKLFFLMHRLAEHYSIEVSDSEVNALIAQMAVQRNLRPEQFRNELMRNNRLTDVAMQVRDNKTADRIIENAKVAEITRVEWQKIVAAKQKAVATGEKPKRSRTTKKAAAEKA
jgi:trigger factor